MTRSRYKKPKSTYLAEAHQRLIEKETRYFSTLTASLIERYWDDSQPTESLRAITAALTTQVTARRSRLLQDTIPYLEQFHKLETGKTIDLSKLLTVRLPSANRVARELESAGLTAVRKAIHSGGTSPMQEYVERALAGSAGKLTRAGSDLPHQQFISSGQGPVGYVRVTESHPCAFCAMLASRGAAHLYTKTNSAPLLYSQDAFHGSAAEKRARAVERGETWTGSDVAVHNHCSCTLKPVYKINGNYSIPERSKEYAKLWSQIGAGERFGRERFNRYLTSQTLPPDYQGPLKGVRRPLPIAEALDRHKRAERLADRVVSLSFQDYATLKLEKMTGASRSDLQDSLAYLLVDIRNLTDEIRWQKLQGKDDQSYEIRKLYAHLSDLKALEKEWKKLLRNK